VRPASGNSQQRRGAGPPDASRRDRGRTCDSGWPHPKAQSRKEGTCSVPRPPQGAASGGAHFSRVFRDFRELGPRRGVVYTDTHRHGMENISALRASGAQRRPVPRACISAPRIKSPTQANLMSHATKPYVDSRQRKSKPIKTIRRPHPPNGGIMSPKMSFRDNSPRDKTWPPSRCSTTWSSGDHLCRQKRDSATKFAATKPPEPDYRPAFTRHWQLCSVAPARWPSMHKTRGKWPKG
jgi:hypothetical protein